MSPQASLLIALVILAGCEPKAAPSATQAANDAGAAPARARGNAPATTISTAMAMSPAAQQRRGMMTQARQKSRELREQWRDATGELPQDPDLPNPAVEGGRIMGQDNFETRYFYPGYILCTYDIEEVPYDPKKEPARFADALQQVRDLGPKRFPPYNYMVVEIGDNGLPQGSEEKYIASRMAGAIFDLPSVFDKSKKIEDLVSAAAVDRHPIAINENTTPMVPMYRVVWPIVENAMRAAGRPVTRPSIQIDEP